jgi:hypothetical protein
LREFEEKFDGIQEKKRWKIKTKERSFYWFRTKTSQKLSTVFA